MSVIWGILFSCPFCFAADTSAGGGWNAAVSTPVCTAAGDQQSPSISSGANGLVVVWQDSRPDGKTPDTKYPWSVYGRYLGQDKDFSVFIPADANATIPVISGDNVVFMQNRGWANLMLAKLTKEKSEIKAIEGQANMPFIDGSMVVFSSGINRTGEDAKLSWITDIRCFEINGIGSAMDVAAGKTKGGTKVLSCPAVSGSVVVWQENRDGTKGGLSDWFIYRRDLNADADPVRVAGSPGSKVSNPAISGSMIVWQDNRNGDWDIYGYDIKSGKERVIYMGTGDQANPKIHGSVVVWQDNRSGNWDIYGTDLTAGKVFPVFVGPANQTQPAIFGDVVVWTDDRGKDKDIYMNRQQTEKK